MAHFLLIFIFYIQIIFPLPTSSIEIDLNTAFTICAGSPTNPGKKLPETAEAFSVTHEVVQYSNDEISRPPVVLLDLTYNKTSKMLAVKNLAEGTMTEIIVNFGEKKIFQIMPKDSNGLCTCATTKCSNQNQNECTYDFSIIPQLGQFNPVLDDSFPGIDVFGVIPPNVPMYMGEDKFNELVTVDRWDYCGDVNSSWPNMSQSWTVDDWSTPLKKEKIPIMLALKVDIGDSQNISGQNISDQNIIQVIPVDYRPHDVQPIEIFQPPVGCFCESWPGKLDFPIPSEAKAFHFYAEAVGTKEKSITWSEEWFDLENGYIRIDHKSMNDYGIVSEIIDYNLGVVYFITGWNKIACTAKPLSEVTMDILDTPSEATLMQIRIKTPENFFGKDGTTFVHIGERKARGVDSLVWQGIRNDQIGGSNITGLWEWYFNKPIVETDKATIPLMKIFTLLTKENKVSSTEAYVELNPGDQVIHHISGFEYLTPETMDITAFDITPCSTGDVYLQLKFEIDIKPTEVIVKNGDIFGPTFLIRWRNLLADKGNVSCLRIAKIGPEVIEDKVYIKFRLLDGNSETIKKDPTTKEEALRKITNSIDSWEMFIQWKDLPRTTVKAIRKSLTGITVIPGNNNCISTTSLPVPESSSKDSINVDSSTSNPIVVTYSPVRGNSKEETPILHTAGIAVLVCICCFIAGLGVGGGLTHFFRTQVLEFLNL